MWRLKRKDMLGLGEMAPQVRMRLLNGEMWGLHDALLEQRILLVFFKISCPTCQFTLPFLERMSASAPGGIVLVSQDDAGKTREFEQQFGITLPTLIDEGQAYAASNAYRISHVPSMFLIAQDGTIAKSINGFQRAELESVGLLFGIPAFRPGERVPILRPG